MTTLPYAPLTLRELNDRVADKVSEIAWYVAAHLRNGDAFEDWAVASLRVKCAELDDLQAAAAARAPGLRP